MLFKYPTNFRWNSIMFFSKYHKPIYYMKILAKSSLFSLMSLIFSGSFEFWNEKQGYRAAVNNLTALPKSSSWLLWQPTKMAWKGWEWFDVNWCILFYSARGPEHREKQRECSMLFCEDVALLMYIATGENDGVSHFRNYCNYWLCDCFNWGAKLSKTGLVYSNNIVKNFSHCSNTLIKERKLITMMKLVDIILQL